MDATASAIADIADFVRIIKEEPEWADTVRGILLGQDLLELPARFNELVATLAENNRLVRARLAMLEQQFERLDSGLDDFKQETRTRFDKLEGGLDELKSDLDDFKQETRTRFDKLEGGLDELKGDLDDFKQETRTRFDKLEGGLDDFKQETRTRFDKLEGDLDDFKQEARTRFDKLEGELGQLVGTDLERKVHANVVTYLTRLLNLHGKTRILKSAFIPMQDELHDLLFEAADCNLSEAQIERIGLTDVVLSGQRQGQPVYVTIEVSRTIANHDIARAADSARFMRAASGRTTLPVVIGCYMAEEQRRQAQRLNVAVRIIKAG